MTEASGYAYRAKHNADQAAGRTGEEYRTDAIGEGLSAIAYALLDVAAAIRQHTQARR